MFTIMGATGRTGGRIALALLERGNKVRAIGRSEGRLAALGAAGAEVVAGDAADPGFLTNTFRGADGVYTLIPPDPAAPDYRARQDRYGESIIAAVRDSGVRFVVFLSSLGAEIRAGTGPIAGLHAQEERFRRLQGVNVLLLRAAYFFENFCDSVGLISQGINGGPLAADLRIPMVATRDVADVAAAALQDRNWNGVVERELLGERDLTIAEAMRILGESLGRPDLPYVQFPYADVGRSLVQMGFSENVAELYVELARALNAGSVKSLEGRTAGNTTRTRFEDFVQEIRKSGTGDRQIRR